MKRNTHAGKFRYAHTPWIKTKGRELNRYNDNAATKILVFLKKIPNSNKRAKQYINEEMIFDNQFTNHP